MSRHTPGPWITRGESVVAHRPHVSGGYNEEPVQALTRTPEERLANAALIAAAPELLEALEAWHKFMLENYSKEDISFWDQTVNSIARAKAK